MKQNLKVVAKPKKNISTNKEPGASIGPSHQKAPMASQDCLYKSIASACQGIAAGKFRIRQCNQYCCKKGQTKGEKSSWPCQVNRFAYKDENSPANSTTDA